VMATITVADVDWLAAADRAAEVRTLRALGWPASGEARLVAGQAALLGIVGGVIAGVLDVVGCLAVAHQVPGPVLAAAAVAAGAGLLLSLVAAGLSAVIGRTTSVIGLRHEFPAGGGHHGRLEPKCRVQEFIPAFLACCPAPRAP